MCFANMIQTYFCGGGYQLIKLMMQLRRERVLMGAEQLRPASGKIDQYCVNSIQTGARHQSCIEFSTHRVVWLVSVQRRRQRCRSGFGFGAGGGQSVVCQPFGRNLRPVQP